VYNLKLTPGPLFVRFVGIDGLTSKICFHPNVRALPKRPIRVIGSYVMMQIFHPLIHNTSLIPVILIFTNHLFIYVSKFTVGFRICEKSISHLLADSFLQKKGVGRYNGKRFSIMV
jgi:hypothetical protein